MFNELMSLKKIRLNFVADFLQKNNTKPKHYNSTNYNRSNPNVFEAVEKPHSMCFIWFN